MRKLIKVLVVLLLAVVAIVLAAVPYAVPPIVERVATEKLAAFGVNAAVRLKLGYCWRNGPGIEGKLRVAVPDTPWRVGAEFGASCCEWSAKVTMPETAYSESDPLVKALLKKFPPKGDVTNLVFSGSLALDAKAERTFRMPVPVWNVTVPVKNFNGGLTSKGQDISIEGFSVTAGASGIADRKDVRPMFVRAKSVAFGGFALTNFYATVRATEKSLMANEIGAEFCGGKVNVYSLFLDPKNLNTGFTLFLDGVDAGKALGHLKGFRGEASGRLHGKVRAFVVEGGRALRLREAFLYSTPGETGKLRMQNPETVTENLAYAGLDDATRGNVADALTDLDYSVLRLDLARLDGTAARLTVQLRGSATRGQTTVPVDLTINLNGELEQLINTGLGYSSKLKGKKK